MEQQLVLLIQQKQTQYQVPNSSHDGRRTFRDGTLLDADVVSLFYSVDLLEYALRKANYIAGQVLSLIALAHRTIHFQNQHVPLRVQYPHMWPLLSGVSVKSESWFVCPVTLSNSGPIARRSSTRKLWDRGHWVMTEKKSRKRKTGKQDGRGTQSFDGLYCFPREYWDGVRASTGRVCR